MSLLRIGDSAPDFTAKGILGGQVADYSPASFKNKWLVLFFYPADFTFICPTEVTGFSKMTKAFTDQGAAILGVSVDSIDSHRSWAEELGGLNCPLLGDEAKSLSRAYGVLDEKEGVALRATFIVDPDNTIQHVSVNNLNVGRNPDEILRILDGLQTDELCPCNRTVGGQTL